MGGGRGRPTPLPPPGTGLVKTVYIYVYVFRIIQQGLGMLCKWNIGGDCSTLFSLIPATRAEQETDPQWDPSMDIPPQRHLLASDHSQLNPCRRYAFVENNKTLTLELYELTLHV